MSPIFLPIGLSGQTAPAGGGYAGPVIESIAGSADNELGYVDADPPSGLALNDLSVILLCTNDVTAAGNQFTQPGGWNLAYGYGGGTTTDVGISVYWDVASGIESAMRFTADTAGSDCWAKWYRITGADLITPFDVIGTAQDTTAAFSVTVDAITTTVDDCLALYLFGLNVDGNTFAITAGDPDWVQKHNGLAGATNPCSGGTGAKDIATAGTTVDVTLSSSASGDYSGVQMAIAPA